MADLGWSEIIRSYPIGPGLDTFLTSFTSLCESKGIPCSGEALDYLDNKDFQNVAIQLLSALQVLEVSRLLPFGSKTLLNGLVSLFSTVAFKIADLDRVKPLLKAVIAKKPDEEIWSQVYHAVTRMNASRLQQTASSRNMGSLVNSSEYRVNTDPVLKEDLGPMYVDIPQLYETFFGSAELESASQTIFEKCCAGSDPLFREGWTGWPRGAQESAVLSWLQKMVARLTQWAQEHRRTPKRGLGLLAKPNKPLGGSTAQRKLDVGIVTQPESLAHWSQILIPGELKSSPDEDQKDGAWFDIGRYVREVFAAQETRSFVLAFTLCGSLFRMWVFDRLGGIASTRFDINKDGLRFVTTILGFLWIEGRELGFDSTITTENNIQYINIIRDGKQERIVIDKLLGRAWCIVGRATTCWKAHPEGNPSMTLVIKDSWQYPERDEEGELLLKVTKKGVLNVARYYHHETIRLPNGNVDDIQHGIRKGLDITKASNYRSQHPDPPQDSDTLRISQDSVTGQKRSSSQTGAPLPSNERSFSESLTKVDRGTLPNRIHRRVIVRDYGQPIYKASSLAVLLAAFDGCIEGHKSLLRKASILHRDISINNLMINEDNKDNNNASWSSFLIDLDLSIRIDRRNASGARRKTGTRAFMAIGVLRGEQHSFIHDLESFFWVLFWICVHYNTPGESTFNEFEDWNYASMHELVTLKIGTVANEQFFVETLTRSCKPYYKPLIPWINKLRKVVFDGNEGEDEARYSRMQEVLREAQKDPDLLYAQDGIP
ncbi:hypothetical protein F5B19DRAFT_472032 [Rostrohypoxylon terebratum]|nr:hypothetical protein F5B19DRAFT_472032 [Rostrohypoxylon terebratum]